ncbi:DUF6728 family protein [Bacteroidota bacterium]
MSDNHKPYRLYDLFGIREIIRYFLRRIDPDEKPSINLRVMHVINRISIIIFFIAVVVILIRRIIG